MNTLTKEQVAQLRLSVGEAQWCLDQINYPLALVSKPLFWSKRFTPFSRPLSHITSITSSTISSCKSCVKNGIHRGMMMLTNISGIIKVPLVNIRVASTSVPR